MSLTEAFKRTAFAWELRRAKRIFTPPRARDFYRSIIPTGAGAIIDVGAHMGDKTEIFRHLADRVISIEPDPQSAETLRSRFKWRNVTVLAYAVSSEPGELRFYQFNPGSAFNTVDPAWAQTMTDGSNHMGHHLAQPRELRVAAITLANIERRYGPSKYIKIDAEGHEAEVLSTLTTPVKLVSLEFNLPQMYGALGECVERLRSIGSYRFNAVISDPPLRFEFNKWVSADDIVHVISSRGWGYAELYARRDE